MKKETKKALIIEMIHTILLTDSEMPKVADQLREDKALTSQAIEKVRHLKTESRKEVVAKIKKGYAEDEIDDDLDNLTSEAIDNAIEAVVDIYLMIKQ